MEGKTLIGSLGIGKRKSAIAKVKIFKGTGEFFINNISGINYLQTNVLYYNTSLFPLEVLGLEKNYDILAFVNGGGIKSQAVAIQLAIAKILSKLDNNFNLKLRNLKLLTRDSRIKERKKYGLKKARKASQYSKR